jgi:hypothetical protein
VLRNRRFSGAWALVSFQLRRPGGEVNYPWGQDPVGIVIWDESGHVSAQLGPRNADGAGYVAYFGVFEADDAVEGTAVTHVVGASSARFRSDQLRHFRFDGNDGLELSPPPAPDGTVSILLWRRLFADA